ncbi:MAG: type II secretion system F family protein [Candidatus Omnitrophota bacterium]
MFEYNFVAKDKNGNMVKDSILCRSRFEAISLLKERDLTVVSISYSSSVKEEYREKGRPAETKKQFFSFPAASKISLREFSIFCRQLSVSISSGINLIDALQSITHDTENPYFKKVLLEVNNDIRNGKAFSEALSRHKRAFNPIFIALMRAGEESGSMSMVLDYLSQYLEKNLQLQRKIQSITAYPIFVAAFFSIVVVILTLFIMPRFQDLFAGFGAQLPLFSRVVFAINAFMIHNILWITLGIACLAVIFIIYSGSVIGRDKIDRFKLNMVFLGEVIRKASLARFCRMLAIMIRGGVPIVLAIEISSRACSNRALEKAMADVKDRIINGSDISGSLAKDENFPRLLVQMVGVGETSGRLPQVLDTIASMYEDEVEGSIMVITSLFEPFVIIVFGGIILALVLSVYVPIFKIAMTMRG